MRLLLTALAALTSLLSAPASAADRCLAIDELLGKELQKIGGRDWFAIQLNKNAQSWYLLFEQSGPDGNRIENPKWLVTSRHSEGRPDLYCVVGEGTGTEPLASLHQSKFEDRFGMPGSGHPRCGGTDVLDGLKVRAWASRELGESVIIAYEGGAKADYTLLMGEGDHWVLLDSKKGGGTCYHDRGEGVKVQKLKLKAPR